MQYIQHNNSDDVAVALVDLAAGTVIKSDENPFLLEETILAGHKFALRDMDEGQTVTKYGVRIGICTSSIRAGQHVHVHNIKTALDGFDDYKYEPQNNSKAQAQAQAQAQASLKVPVSKELSPVFQGYRREDGKVGTRNEVWVLSTVGCVSRLAERIAWKANERYQNECDGVFAFTHPYGCSQTGEDLDNTRLVLTALAQHANAGAVLILGLGCENNQGVSIVGGIPEERRSKVHFFNCQDVSDELEEGLAKVGELVELISQDQRSDCALSELVIGMKCGGSDGFSGLSANPLVGRIADKISASSGTVLLTETPEMFGAEQILMNRASSETVFEGIVELINEFKAYFINHGQNIYENPSPGNKDGGISTLEEKSMGAIQKGGTATVTSVLQYAEPVVEKGLSLLQAPGNDAVSSTALTASGASIILFTSGRGTPMGYPAPTIKISSNTRLAQSKSNWIDFDAGPILDGQPLDTAANELLAFIVEVASGRIQTKAEINDQREIAIWKNGVTL